MTSNFTPKVSGLKFSYLSPQTNYDPISGKNKIKFKNQAPDNHENPFALSFKANFMTIQASMK